MHSMIETHAHGLEPAIDQGGNILCRLKRRKGVAFQNFMGSSNLPVGQDGVYDAFVEAVTESVGKLKLGSGMDPSTTLGPLINDRGVQRVRAPLHPADSGTPVRLALLCL